MKRNCRLARHPIFSPNSRAFSALPWMGVSVSFLVFSCETSLFHLSSAIQESYEKKWRMETRTMLNRVVLLLAIGLSLVATASAHTVRLASLTPPPAQDHFLAGLGFQSVRILVLLLTGYQVRSPVG